MNVELKKRCPGRRKDSGSGWGSSQLKNEALGTHIEPGMTNRMVGEPNW
jgi:hypothetical protein